LLPRALLRLLLGVLIYAAPISFGFSRAELGVRDAVKTFCQTTVQGDIL
jgi:hypothetical protein